MADAERRRAWAFAIAGSLALAGCDGGKGASVSAPKPAAPESHAGAAADEEPVAEESGDDGAEGQGDAPLAPLPSAAPHAIAEGALADEAARELAALRTSAYTHRTSVDEAAGAFDFDCSGFVVYALRRVAPSALEPLRARSQGRPLARDFAALFASGDARAMHPWRAVSSVASLHRGDVVAWRKPADVESTNTGHVMVVDGAPSARGVNEWVVPIVDSTAAPHGKRDDRHARKATGLGRGTIVLVTDAHGAPTAYRWSEWRGSKTHVTSIALGRVP